MQTLISLKRKKSWKVIYKFKSKEGDKKEGKELIKEGVKYLMFEFNWLLLQMGMVNVRVGSF